MKRSILAAAALAAATPVFAEGDGKRYDGETSAGNPALVIAHFAQDREGGDGPKVLIPESSDVTLSTASSDLVTFAAEKLSNGERGFN